MEKAWTNSLRAGFILRGRLDEKCTVSIGTLMDQYKLGRAVRPGYKCFTRKVQVGKGGKWRYKHPSKADQARSADFHLKLLKGSTRILAN